MCDKGYKGLCIPRLSDARFVKGLLLITPSKALCLLQSVTEFFAAPTERSAQIISSVQGLPAITPSSV